jgi:hypothetical protein
MPIVRAKPNPPTPINFMRGDAPQIGGGDRDSLAL